MLLALSEGVGAAELLGGDRSLVAVSAEKDAKVQGTARGSRLPANPSGPRTACCFFRGQGLLESNKEEF